MKEVTKKYTSKILLFGEYTVINGSDALAIPCSLFHGSWSTESGHHELYLTLKKLGQYLSSLSFTDARFEEKKYNEAIETGLIFQSNIPIGYGVGSSGALSAAIFDRFYSKENNLDITTLKTTLGKIESFFHGASSGVDPLISYLNKGFLISHHKTPEAITLNNTQLPFQLFLLDTTISRKTEPLVAMYLEKYETNLAFKKVIRNELFILNNLAIQHTLSGNWKALFEVFHQISTFQHKHLNTLIPKKYAILWEQGLVSDHYKIKLCGAGGGGFLLGISSNYEATKKHFGKERILPIQLA